LVFDQPKWQMLDLGRRRVYGTEDSRVVEPARIVLPTIKNVRLLNNIELKFASKKQMEKAAIKARRFR
jgi:hypothetical protein